MAARDGFKGKHGHAHDPVRDQQTCPSFSVADRLPHRPDSLAQRCRIADIRPARVSDERVWLKTCGAHSLHATGRGIQLRARHKVRLNLEHKRRHNESCGGGRPLAGSESRFQAS